MKKPTSTVIFWRDLYFKLANEVEQVLGKALSYPKYVDDQKNFPGAKEEDGVCVGEHVPESILAEAANFIEDRATAAEKRLLEIVALQSENKSVRVLLQSVCDRDWKDEDLHTVAQIAANAIVWRDREIKKLKEKAAFVRERLQWLQNEPSSNYLTDWQRLVTIEALQGYAGVSGAEVLPASVKATIGERLISYFNKRAKENKKRSEKLENKKKTFHRLDEYTQDERSSYYFSGKSEAYENAAHKVKELLNG